MLLANIWVGRRITEAFPRCALLRRHPSPPAASYEQLQSAAKSVGVTLRVGTSKELADSLDEAIDATRPHLNKLLRILTTRCMMQATYFCSGELPPVDYLHYGLATPIYTHFTSPIRRLV
jgi:exosome complex exonuclease DIS3/RRP44